MVRSKHRAFRRAAWLALFALFLQTIVPVLHHPASAALPDVVSANLCMAPGSPPVAPSDPDKLPAHGTQTCAICQTLHILGGGFVPPDVVAVAPAVQLGTVSITIPAVAILDGRAVSQTRARAPPAKA